MSVKTAHSLCDQLYFCTFTCTDWLNLFEITNTYDEVYKWFRIVHEKGYHIVAFTIIPNHLHFIINTLKQNVTLDKLVSNGKRFIAYEIVERLKQQNETAILKHLEEAVTPSDRKRGKLHQVFKPSFDGRRIYSEQMLIQKINYIHHNCVSKKWNLAKDYLQYPHSSAAFYELGTPACFPLTNYTKVLYGENATQ